MAYQARLESACRLWRPWVRIPPSPPIGVARIENQIKGELESEAKYLSAAV